MLTPEELEKAIVEGIVGITMGGYSTTEKPDTPDNKSIEENNNPEGKVIATSIKVEMTPFQPRLQVGDYFIKWCVDVLSVLQGLTTQRKHKTDNLKD